MAVERQISGSNPIHNFAIARPPSNSTTCFPSTDISVSAFNGGDCDAMNIRDALSEMLCSVHHFNHVQVCRDDQFNQDALIRGVILGWEDLQSRDFTCPLWGILKHIDALLMTHTAIATRLALLRGVHLMLLTRSCPDRPPALPPWFRPRARRNSPNQCSNPNDAISNYFAWPRFRQRLLASNSPRLTNRFWLYFVRNVQFEWPFSPTHTIDIDKDSGKYHFSMNWRNTMDIIQRFTMGPEFFDAYPECSGDMNPRCDL
ncbi:hypothetical protein FE257_009227 [Aspergillus nanangensis]|uniref:Uncharacterized protein n=1 Tax=Aspergillus nanangensis TaxID=2582783 RepID=A0AAD4CKZ3_ASPNN|nr:hypothetical protein FE257_009227 [Aspergillus nanangensis]